MNFKDHSEKARIQRWLNSATGTQLVAKYGISLGVISSIKRSLNGKTGAVFSQMMEWRVLNAVRLYEAEACGGVKPALAEIKTAAATTSPASQAPSNRKTILQDLILDEIQTMDHVQLAQLYAEILRNK